MELQILVSKKGTKVVTATNLHRALRLPAHTYNKHLNKWLSDVYAFKDDIRYAIELKDFAHRNFKHSKLKDFYLSLELAKLITLNSDSAYKQIYAKYLMAMEGNISIKPPKTILNKSPIPPTLFDGGGGIPTGAQLNLW